MYKKIASLLLTAFFGFVFPISGAYSANTSKADTLDKLLTPDQQAKCGLTSLTPEQRNALAKQLLSVYEMGGKKQYTVMSSYGPFKASLLEFNGAYFVFDVDLSDMRRIQGHPEDLSFYPDTVWRVPVYQITSILQK